MFTQPTHDLQWMGCDVGKQFDRKLGVWDLSLLQQELVYGFEYEMRDKASRLRYGQTLMTHAMLFTGVDVDEATGETNKWRVENSWGTENGDKGFHTMNDNWFEEHMFEIAAHPRYVMSC